MARTSGAKRKRQEEDTHRDVMRDMAMWAVKAEAQFYQRVVQLQTDIQSGRHAIYRFTSDREASPAVQPEVNQACSVASANELGHQDPVHEERGLSNQFTASNNLAQTPRPIQTSDSRVTPAGIPGAKNCLADISFVFTGEFEGITREGAKVLVQLHGGKVEDFPTTKTHYVVLGMDVDPYKLEILGKKHLKTISEAGLYDLIRILSQSPQSDVLRVKRQRIEQTLKESVDSRASRPGDRHTDEQNNAWSGEPKVADDALRFAQSRVSQESAYHAPAQLTNVPKSASSAMDSLYSSRASWTPETHPVAQPPAPTAQQSVLDSDVLEMIAALPAQVVNSTQSMPATVASAKAAPVVHDDRAKPTTLDASHSGSMRVIGSLHDLVESDETREDSYSPPSADVPGAVIDWSGANGRPKRLRGVSQPTVGLASLYHMSPSNFDADEDNKSESDYSPPPADARPAVASKKPLPSGPAAKKGWPTKAEKQAAHVQRLQEAARRRELRAARKAANQAAAQKAVAQKAANKKAAKKVATQKATAQRQQKPQAPRRFQELLQDALNRQNSANLIEVVPISKPAPLQHAKPPRAPPVAPKAARSNQERTISQQPVRVDQRPEESSADDVSWQPTSRIKRESESAPVYSRYNVDTDSRKLLVRNDGGVDIGVNSPPRAPDRQLPYGQKPLPQQWPYHCGSRREANLESSEDSATITKKRDKQKYIARTQQSGHSTVRPTAARHDPVPQEILPPPPRRRIIVDEYGNKYIAIPATGPFADMPELQDLLAGSDGIGLSARENARITQARQPPTNVIDLEDSDCYEAPPPTAPKAMLSKQKNVAQSEGATLSKNQKRKAHRALLEQQQRDQHEQHRIIQKQNKNFQKAAKASQADDGSNNVRSSDIPPYDRAPHGNKFWIDPLAPYLVELRGQVQPQTSQIPGPAHTPLPPMSASMQTPLPLPPGVPFPPPTMGAPFQPMYGQFPPPPPPMAGFGGPPRPYSAQPGFAHGPAPFQPMPVMPNNTGFPMASPHVQHPPYQTPVFGQMSMYAPQPSPFLGAGPIR